MGSILFQGFHFVRMRGTIVCDNALLSKFNFFSKSLKESCFGRELLSGCRNLIFGECKQRCLTAAKRRFYKNEHLYQTLESTPVVLVP